MPNNQIGALGTILSKALWVTWRRIICVPVKKRWYNMWNDLIHLDKGPLKILGETKKLFKQTEKNQLDEFKLIEIFAMVGKNENPNSSK